MKKLIILFLLANFTVYAQQKTATGNKKAIIVLTIQPTQMIATAVIIATTTANTFRPITRPPVFELIKALPSL